MMKSMAMKDICHLDRDWVTTSLSTFLICGLVISYIPQHRRIIKAGTSEGFSPWFLLLGSTSAAAGMLNMIALQWPVIQCCNELSTGKCLEITAGVIQVALQWFLFSVILVLYLIYYPPQLKYVELDLDAHDSRPAPQHRYVRTTARSSDWNLSIILSWVVAIHLAGIIFTTFFLILTNPSYADPSTGTTGTEPSRQLSLWATFLGVSSALLAAVQYTPQLVRSYRLKVVGALSIPMMVMQTPGGVFMAVSIGRRPGTNWTSWGMFAVSAAMQGCLLVMCIFWKVRQHRLGLDDFGHRLKGGDGSSTPGSDETRVGEEDADAILRDREEIVGDVDIIGVDDIIDVDAGDAREETPLLAGSDAGKRKGKLRIRLGRIFSGRRA
ncbi:hypothetical protein BJ138DRAFT_1152644 [Hygrophoropsis aurantiaca]|uniref:Uncharacterized protein n=1 Tax=Hygrophoropsis aurantiaca TaxID=72124 RepID=A0ACB8AB50_9AGAM|nr:hypothetical protein BJ138DRAFT_1152644 [Hygrophoropsis aurantiaca]